jgi:hypothetical protein
VDVYRTCEHLASAIIRRRATIASVKEITASVTAKSKVTRDLLADKVESRDYAYDTFSRNLKKLECVQKKKFKFKSEVDIEKGEKLRETLVEELAAWRESFQTLVAGTEFDIIEEMWEPDPEVEEGVAAEGILEEEEEEQGQEQHQQDDEEDGEGEGEGEVGPEGELQQEGEEEEDEMVKREHNTLEEEEEKRVNEAKERDVTLNSAVVDGKQDENLHQHLQAQQQEQQQQGPGLWPDAAEDKPDSDWVSVRLTPATEGEEGSRSLSLSLTLSLPLPDVTTHQQSSSSSTTTTTITAAASGQGGGDSSSSSVKEAVRVLLHDALPLRVAPPAPTSGGESVSQSLSHSVTVQSPTRHITSYIYYCNSVQR